MSYNTYDPKAASNAKSLGVSTNFNQQSALATSNAGEYIPFKTKYDLDKRMQCYEQAVKKFPTKLGLIIEKAPNTNSARIKSITNPKFMMPKTFTVGEVLAVL